MIQRYKFSEEDYRNRFKDYEYPLQGNNDLLSLTQPDAIREIHEKFLDVGADIIETNTFSSTAMADYHMENLIYELNFESPIQIQISPDLLSIGPTNKTASMSPDVNDPGFRAITFDEIVNSYSEQIEALIDGGVEKLYLIH